MATLTTEYGTFEADTEKELLKQSRAAKRKAQKQEKIDHENREMAKLYAHRNASRIMEQYIEHGCYLCKIGDKIKMPQGWMVYQEGKAHFKLPEWDDGHRIYTFHGEHGTAQFRLLGTPRFYTRISHILENGAGWPMACWTIDQDNRVEFYAIGVCKDQFYSVRLPSQIHEHLFRQSKENEER